MYSEDIINIKRGTPMAGVKGKSGRHKSEVEREGFFFRLRPDVIDRVERCMPLLDMQEGVRMSKAEALEHLLTIACEVVERIREGSETPTPAPISEISEISPARISKLSEISGDDMSVPGYGFPEDEEDEAEIPALASHTNGTHAPALAVAMPQAAETPSAVSEPIVEQTPAPQQEMLEPAVKTTPELSEDIVKIAEARAQYNRMSERVFTQLLFDRGIYRHRAKDGSEVPLPHSTLREWLQRAREAGVL